MRAITLLGLLATCLLLTIPPLCKGAEAPPLRERLSVDRGWKFHLGDDWPDALRLDKAGTSSGPAAVDFDDTRWRSVDLPHDWAVELPFDENADRSHGYKPLGLKFPGNSIAWYRREFPLPAADDGRRLWLEFDGIFRDATVWVNGWLISHHESGYAPLREDITDVLNIGGTNTIAVRVDASKFEGWFYEGAGIYRHAWLERRPSLGIADDGVFVHSEFPNNIPVGPATLKLHAAVQSKSRKNMPTEVRWHVLNSEGLSIAEGHSPLQAITPGRTVEFMGEMIVEAPTLWSPEQPRLYKLITSVVSEGHVLDKVETSFGIRTIGFDPAIGFLLNGKRYEIHGTCNHQDHAGVGVALPSALHEFRVRKLKEFGCNAYRTAHHAPSRELLDICDRVGLLVMDENRLLGSNADNLRLWEDQIRRDRNHPSVVIWSIANEELAVHDSPQAARVALAMQDMAKHLDPTRPVTYAANEGNVFQGINSVIEVRGWNYHLGSHVDDYHASHPSQPIIGTEQASVVGTRGIYSNDYERGQVSSYDIVWPGWDTTAESWWTFFAERKWLSGAFAWTGFDYRGEPSPCNWPSISSHFGILDTCGFAKDSAYYYKSWWTNAPVLHIAPHWNWPGKEGCEIPVQVFSNCEEVELFLNGTSLGRQVMQRNSKLVWKNVHYAPGILSATGYDKKGTVLIQTKVETSGAPVRLVLSPSQQVINANGEDLSVFTVTAQDREGRNVPVAQNLVSLKIKGPAKIIGVGNGDPNCHEPDVNISAEAAWSRSLFNGLAQVLVQATRDAGEITLTASAAGLENAQTTIEANACPLRPSL